MIDFENTKALQELIRKYPGRVLDYLNSCNETQWLSKEWLAEELNLYLYKHGKREGSYNIILLGGWYGLLAHILIEELGIEIGQIDSYDIDYMAKKIGKILPIDKDIINYYTQDVAEINFGSPSFAISSGNADANGYGNFEYAVPSGYYALCTKNLADYG